MTKLQSWFCCSLFFFAACALDEDSGAVEDLEAPLPQRDGETPDIGGAQGFCCRPPPPGVRSSDTSAPQGDEPDVSGTRPPGAPPVPPGAVAR